MTPVIYVDSPYIHHLAVKQSRTGVSHRSCRSQHVKLTQHSLAGESWEREGRGCYTDILVQSTARAENGEFICTSFRVARDMHKKPFMYPLFFRESRPTNCTTSIAPKRSQSCICNECFSAPLTSCICSFTENNQSSAETYSPKG